MTTFNNFNSFCILTNYLWQFFYESLFDFQVIEKTTDINCISSPWDFHGVDKPFMFVKIENFDGSLRSGSQKWGWRSTAKHVQPANWWIFDDFLKWNYNLKITRQIDMVLRYLASECCNLTNFSSEIKHLSYQKWPPKVPLLDGHSGIWATSWASDSASRHPLESLAHVQWPLLPLRPSKRIPDWVG